MNPDKKRRIAFAGGFVTAVLASVRAISDATIFWPPEALWQQLRGPQRFQFVGGSVMAIVMVALSVVYRSREK
jgi:hypothetical protein